MKMRKHLGPLTAVDHAALVHLCKHKKVIQRVDGYGTESETFISRASAVILKKRHLAVTGWNREMYPTKNGHAFAATTVGSSPGWGYSSQPDREP